MFNGLSKLDGLPDKKKPCTKKSDEAQGVMGVKKNLQEILKANPYHDRLGRFANANDRGNHHYVTTMYSNGQASNAKAIQKKLLAKEIAKEKKQKYTEVEPYKHDANSKRLMGVTQKKWDTLTVDEKKQIHEYTGSWYKKINPLVGGSKGDLSNLDEWDREAAMKMDSALKKAGGLPENHVMFKAIDLNHMGLSGYGQHSTVDDLNKLKGKTITDHAYSSMSTSDSVASSFLQNDRVLLRIKAKKGTKGAWVGGYDANGNPRSKYPTEHEFVAARGQSLKIKGASEYNGRIVLDVEI